MDKERQECESRLEALQKELEPILTFLSTGDRVKEIKSAVSASSASQHHQSSAAQTDTSDSATEKLTGYTYLQQKYPDVDIDESKIEELYEFARLEFDSGRYQKAAEHLMFFRLLSSDVEKGYMAQWGRVCAMLMSKTEWDRIRTDVFELREMIESSAVHDSVFHKNPLLVLQHRSWFIHWVLFVFFRSNNERSDTASEKSALVDLYFHDRYLNAIQTNSPHILRYLAATVVIAGRRRRNQLKEVIKMLEQEQFAYSDPVTKLLESLYVKADFDAAQHWLRECEEHVLPNDYFLRTCMREFMDSARLTIFELYCRIHRVVQISSIAERLHMDPISAEKWIIDVIRSNRYSAKIDAESKSVILQEQQHSIYEQILEKTEALLDRTNLLKSNVERKLQ